MSSLFKYVYADGTVKYRDVDRFCGINLDNPNVSYHSGLIDRVMEEKFPITMPYFPESKPFKVYCEDFLVDSKNGDYDTVGILYAIVPEGYKVEINRFFKEENIIRKSLQKYSWKTKCTVAMEEFAELQQQISKQVRGYGDRIGLLEEMADAYICLNFLESIFDIKPEDLQKAIDVKLERERRNL